jgi:hypothetical protein
MHAKAVDLASTIVMRATLWTERINGEPLGHYDTV